MTVVLADPPARERGYDASYPNIGLLYVIAYTRKMLPGLDIYYLQSACNLAEHIAALTARNPTIYGISFTSKTFRLAAKTIAAVKRRFPDTLIVCGGPHPTAMPVDTLSQTEADVVVRGEGEQTFARLVRTRLEGGPMASVPGIVYKDGSQIVENALAPLLPDLDEVPFPAWDLVHHADYPCMHLRKQKVQSSMVISRGCPYDCTFCSNPVWKLSKPWLRFRSSVNIIEEIKQLYAQGVREIYFTSDEMNFSLRWAENLLDEIIALDYRDLYFQTNLRVDKITPEFATKLAAARFWLVHLGMESANDRVLRGLEKCISVSQIEHATQLLSSVGVEVFAFMMLYNVWEEDGTLCFETSREVDNSLAFCSRLLRERRISYMSWQFCNPMPGSRLYDIAKRHQLLPAEDTTIWELFDEHHVTLNLPGISRREMLRKIRRGILLKDWYMLKHGRISGEHLWRAAENLRAFLRR